MEAIALHVAQTYGGAQFYISCGQVEITGGGNGTPGPLVEIPGVYTGYVSILVLHHVMIIYLKPFCLHRNREFSLISTILSQLTILSPVQ